MTRPLAPLPSQRVSRGRLAALWSMFLLTLVALFLGLAASSAQAGSFTTLHSFYGPPNGISPTAGLVQGPAGKFYGTTSGGGLRGNGTVFSMTSAGVITTLINFSGGADGGSPGSALIVGSDGNLYGTTAQGGAVGFGTVFRLTPAGALTTLYSFAGDTDGSNPGAALVQGTDGTFYGTTLRGGQFDNGTIFSVTPAGVETVLYRFDYSDDGAMPTSALLRGSDGNFYGTTQQGGAGGNGTLYRITPAGQLTTLQSFDNGPDGGFPFSAPILGRDGNYYGTTTSGGDGFYGTVYRLTPAGVLTTIYSFSAGEYGAFPYAGLVQGSDGNFYGTTQQSGAANFGTIYRLTPAGVLTTLHNFVGETEGSFSSTTLALGSDGILYGLAEQGGAGDVGTVFSATTGGVFKLLFTFTRSAEGVIPTAGLVQGTDGNFYGTTQLGGLYDNGTVFRMTPAGAVTPLHSFNSDADGSSPGASLLQGTDGNFYGTTQQGGGGGGFGTVFQITPAGVLTTLHSFTDLAEGAIPAGALVQGGDGNFYGTTIIGDGGDSGSAFGTIFRITPGGDLTTLYTFFDGSFYGLSGLTLGSDGSFYGVTNTGANNNGAIFRYPLGGVPTILYNFTGDVDGGSPNAALTLGRDGSFYGLTTAGGSSGGGTVFRFTPGAVGNEIFPKKGAKKALGKMPRASGTLTTLHNFDSATEGSVPFASLAQGADGSFYGTTDAGGASSSGTIFRITPAGVLTNLHSFTGGTDGAFSTAALVQGRDGSLYGTAQEGGANLRGVAFRLRIIQLSSQP